MRLRITHTTTFTYDAPVSEAYMEMRLTPARRGRPALRVLPPAAPIRPARSAAIVDRFGNHVRHFDTLAPHDRLVVTARSEVSTPVGVHRSRRASCRLLDAYDYLQPTAYAPQTAIDRARSRAACAVPGDAAGHRRTR